MNSPLTFTVTALICFTLGCGGGKHRAEHPKGAAGPSPGDTPTASPAIGKRCQIAGFTYAVPAPAALVPAAAAGAQ